MPPPPGADVSGLWLGSFAYPAGLRATTPFLARLVDEGGVLTGSIVEPNTMGRSTDSLEAVIRGARTGSAIDFTKAYDGASDAAHAVDYVGRLSADGLTIAGVWSLPGLEGTFEMHREAVWEEVAGAESEVVRVG